MLYTLIYRLRNGILAGHISIKLEDVGIVTAVLDILWDEGLIRGYSRLNDRRFIKVFFLYSGGKSQIQSLTLFSKSSNFVYISCQEIFRLNLLTNFNGTLILSTSKGIMTADNALRINQGGQILAYII